MIAGVTQLLDPVTSVTFNLTYSQSTGYLSDPYKLVQKRVEVLPGIFLLRTYGENRPDSRRKWIVLAALNRAWPKLAGAVEASYRFHRDDHGLSSHTLNLGPPLFHAAGRRLLFRQPHRHADRPDLAADRRGALLFGGLPVVRPAQSELRAQGDLDGDRRLAG
jgi:hypothetical protein